ncbi:MAG: DUF2236 domain-containing protein [Bacteroidetes bacterium]|nr:DUF2236 domain-containing protein [Bacteroidota bacterium]HET6243118.1 oxygenase MpaB family protein [Bacteroidia bacterium]
MEYFVDKGSIVRKIWGKADTILLIFAGASAEFALNKAVDWLYFTGRLPADPLGRLFSTVSYARVIVFSDLKTAHESIDKISAIHSAVESNRGATIPEWAYRDVLFMLIDYSIRSYELLEQKLTVDEKQEAFDVFYRMGIRMGLKGLPKNYLQFIPMRKEHLIQNLEKSNFTLDLYTQYQKHLGIIRYKLLIETQILIVPEKVNQLLNFGKMSLLSPVISLYKLCRMLNSDWILKSILFPPKYKLQIKALDKQPGI